MTPDVLATLHLSPRNALKHQEAGAALGFLGFQLVQINDWKRVRAYLDGTWPLPAPPFTLNPTTHQARAWFDLAETEPYVVIDTEYVPATRTLTMLALACPRLENGVVYRPEDAGPLDHELWAERLRALIGCVPAVFHNAPADLPILEKAFALTWDHYARVEDTILAHAALWTELPHDLEFLESLYSKYGKVKHLPTSDPRRPWGDALATLNLWDALCGELRAFPPALRTYEDQLRANLPTILKRHALGIKVNKARVKAELARCEQAKDAATYLAHASVGWPINLGSPKQLGMQLYDIAGFPAQRAKKKGAKGARTVDEDAIAALRATVEPIPDLETEAKEGVTVEHVYARVEAGAHGLLEARVLYAAAQQVASHFLGPMVSDGGRIRARVFPEFHIHAQETLRWSTVRPPLAQYPAPLRDLIEPDDGWAWIGWDWSNIEERMLGALANEPAILEPLAQGEDLHERQAVALFGDAARGKAEPYRNFTKRFKYRLYYGGDPTSCSDIPGAKQLGLDGRRLEVLAGSFLGGMPRYLAWRQAITRRVLGTWRPFSEDFTGHRRWLLKSSGRAAVREALNNPLQRGVSSIYNLVAARITRERPEAVFAWGAHDSQWWAVPLADAEAFRAYLPSVVEQTWTIGDVKIAFPAEYKERRCA